MTEKVANGVLSGVVKVSGFFTSSLANSKVGKKFFGLLPGEIVLASLDGFSMFIYIYILILVNNFTEFVCLYLSWRIHSVIPFVYSSRKIE